MIGLTRAQSKLLAYIIERGPNDCPSYDEMRQHLGLASNGNIHRLVSALAERGYIRRIPSRARAIEILSQDEITVCQFSTKEIVKELEQRGYVVKLRLNRKELPAREKGTGLQQGYPSHTPKDRLHDPRRGTVCAG